MWNFVNQIRDNFLNDDGEFAFNRLGGTNNPIAPGGGGGDGERWERYFHCYSPSFANKPELERGNKILLPQSALDSLARMNVSWPMLFELTNTATGKNTHCGVLEFIAEEGTCNLPYWMMKNILGVDEGAMIRVTNTSLQKGTYVKLQPATSNFLDITNPRAVLENALRHFAALTTGDVISIPYNNQIFEIEIVETKPTRAISIIETDVDVDFVPPKDYVEPVPVHRGSTVPSEPLQTGEADEDEEDEEETRPRFMVFDGPGSRLDGKPIGLGEEARSVAAESEMSRVHPEPWTEGIAGGVRRKNQRYLDLVAKGQVKQYTGASSSAAAAGGGGNSSVFHGSGHRLDS